MKLTVDQALQQGVAAHKEGKLPDAERLYRAISCFRPDLSYKITGVLLESDEEDLFILLMSEAKVRHEIDEILLG